MRHFKGCLSFSGLDAISTRTGVRAFSQGSTRHASINTGINQGLRKTRRWDDGPAKPRRQDRERQPNTDDKGPRRERFSEGFGERSGHHPSKPDRPDRAQDKAAQRPRRPTATAISVPYTTAESHFVASTTLITAVLPVTRRKLHKLYISEDAPRTPKHQMVSKARARGLLPTYTKAEDIQAWSRTLHVAIPGARTHALLEYSSPVEPPITTLLPVEEADAPNIKVRLAPQSRENAALNDATETGSDATGKWASFSLNRTSYSNAASRAPQFPLLLWLHEVTNAGNAGALLRTAMYFGADGVLFTGRGTATSSPGVITASRGMSEALRTFRVPDDAARFMHASQAAGWRFIATAPRVSTLNPRRRVADPGEAGLTRDGHPLLAGPAVLILGGEDEGLPQAVLDAADGVMTVPGRSARASQAGLDSLNVSAAGALMVERLLRPGRRLEITDPLEAEALLRWQVPKYAKGVVPDKTVLDKQPAGEAKQAPVEEAVLDEKESVEEAVHDEEAPGEKAEQHDEERVEKLF